ncbi:MAG: acetyl-CoA C-acyltransferase [Bdellovibrionota bacterium]|nr:acetyl-CoA C-acyltransferase [Bdellovibrionota bacterium]
MKETFIIHAKRTPIGRINGSLSDIRVDDLMSLLIKDFKESINFDPAEIDDVLIGCANQAGEDNRNIARMSLLLGGLPFTVPGTTINRLCGSSLDALMGAVARISSGFGDCMLVGGVEGMTRAPYALSKASSSYGRGQKLYDTSFGWRFPNPKMKEMFPLFSMGETAEEVATLLKIAREDQDQFALRSHQNAVRAINEGLFKDEILPVEIKKKKETILISQDEGPRSNTSIEKLASLRPVFREGGSVTAGNSSSLNDGASLVAVVSKEFLEKHNLSPLVQVTGAAVKGIHPNTMGLGPVESTKQLCQKFGYNINDFDVIELNEAFSAQSLGCIRELEADPDKINLNGGSIALGHPLGCSGTRILTTLVHIMKKNSQLRKGLATMCIGVGQGISLSVENCS